MSVARAASSGSIDATYRGPRRSREIAYAALFAVCLTASGLASAADLSLKDAPEPVLAPIWTGFYLGAHVGYTRGHGDVTDVFDYNGDPRADNSIATSGVIAGVQLGYNIQRGNLVFGVEADLGYLKLSGSETADLPNPTGKAENEISARYSMSSDLYGDLTGRVGFVTNRTLVYAKGGVAFLDADFKSHYVGANCNTTYGCGGPKKPSVFDFKESDTLLGWTAGFGVEYTLTRSWSVKLEYQHFDFSNMSLEYSAMDRFPCKYNNGTCGARLRGSADTHLTVDAVMVGLNYQFDRADDEGP